MFVEESSLFVRFCLSSCVLFGAVIVEGTWGSQFVTMSSLPPYSTYRTDSKVSVEDRWFGYAVGGAAQVQLLERFNEEAKTEPLQSLHLYCSRTDMTQSAGALNE